MLLSFSVSFVIHYFPLLLSASSSHYAPPGSHFALVSLTLMSPRCASYFWRIIPILPLGVVHTRTSTPLATRGKIWECGAGRREILISCK